MDAYKTYFFKISYKLIQYKLCKTLLQKFRHLFISCTYNANNNMYFFSARFWMSITHGIVRSAAGTNVPIKP